MLVRTLARFFEAGLPDHALIPAAPETIPLFEEVVARFFPNSAIRVIPGGERRQDSVENALAALASDTEIAVIHDAARPFVSCESIRSVIEAAARHGAATVAIPAIDTILEGDSEGFLQRTPDRSRLWACQTPQAFRVGVIRQAHRMARQEQFDGTDDATLARRAGETVKLVMGSPSNLKITTPFDLTLARQMLREEQGP